MHRVKISAWARRASQAITHVVESRPWTRPVLLLFYTVIFSFSILVIVDRDIEIDARYKGVLFLVQNCMTIFSTIGLERALKDGPWGMWKKAKSWLLLFVLLLGVVGGYMVTFARVRVDAQTVVAQGSILLAYGDGGQLDWARPFSSNIIEHFPLRDLDGDGVKETVVATEAYGEIGSRLVIIDEDGREVVNFETSRRGLKISNVPYPMYDYSTFEIADFLVEDLDYVDGQEILLLANNTSERAAPSVVVGLRPNGEKVAEFWHLGQLRRAGLFDGGRRDTGPLIIILGENRLAGDGGYASVVFALFGSKFFSGDPPWCWNRTVTMASNNLLECIEDLDAFRRQDIGWQLGCPGWGIRSKSDAGSLAWYKWVEPADVGVTHMNIVWVREVVAKGQALWHTARRRVVDLYLTDGCTFRIYEDGRVFGPVGDGPCTSRLVPSSLPCLDLNGDRDH